MTNNKDVKTSSDQQQQQQQQSIVNNTAQTGSNNTATTTSTKAATKIGMDSSSVAATAAANKYANLNKSYRADRLLRISERSPDFHSIHSNNNTSNRQLLRATPFSSSLTRTKSFNPSMFASTTVSVFEIFVSFLYDVL